MSERVHMVAQRYSKVAVGPGTDKVIFGMSLPRGTIINQVNANVSIWSTGRADAKDVYSYGAEIWILPVLDPDAAATYDLLFDQLVPKEIPVSIHALPPASFHCLFQPQSSVTWPPTRRRPSPLHTERLHTSFGTERLCQVLRHVTSSPIVTHDCNRMDDVRFTTLNRTPDSRHTMR